jgi:predicted aspartyl protease/Flp pilus assembly protein TadD
MATNVNTKHVLAAVVLLCLCISAMAAPAESAASLQTPQHETVNVGKEIKKGLVAIKRGEYEAAIDCFAKASNQEPDNIAAKLGGSWAYLKSRRYVEATGLAWDVIEADPTNPRAFALLGTSLMRVGLLGQALGAFRKANTKDSGEALATAGLAEIALYMGDFGASLNYIRRAVALAPNEPDFLYMLGHVAARQEQFREAADAYDAFLASAPRLDKERREKIRGLIGLYKALNGLNLYAIRGPGSVDMPFAFSERQLPTIEVTINNQGPFRFVVDTGSGFVVISEETAAKLKVKPIARGGNSQGVGGGGSFPIVYGLLRNFGFGETKVLNVPAYVRKFHHAPSSRIDGFVGLSVISRFNAAIDYGRRRFELRPRDTVTPDPGPNDFSVLYRVTTGGMLSVPADIGVGTELNFIVDTGASSSVLSADLISKLKLNEKVDPNARVQVTGAGGITDGVPVVVLDKLAVIGTSPEQFLRRDFVRALVLDLDTLNETAGFMQAGIIGGNVLRHYRLELDFARGRLILRSPDADQQAQGEEGSANKT